MGIHVAGARAQPSAHLFVCLARCSYSGVTSLNAAHYLVQEILDDDTAVTIRAVRPDDKARISWRFGRSNLIRSTPAFSRENGIERGGAAATHRDRLCQRGRPPGDNRSEPQETVIGLGRYVASGESAEVAFVVEEDYPGRGIARRLLQHLTHTARESGLQSSKLMYSQTMHQCSRCFVTAA